MFVLHPTAGNKCLSLGDKMPPYMLSVPPGGLLQAITKAYLPPAGAPLPPLEAAEVVEPPLPSVPPAAPSSIPTAAQPPKNAQAKVTVSFFLSALAVLVASLLL